MVGPVFTTTADLAGWNARGSGMSATIVNCDWHDQSWLAVFCARSDVPGPAPQSLHIEVVNGDQVVLAGPVTISTALPCGCDGPGMSPAWGVEWFER